MENTITAKRKLTDTIGWGFILWLIGFALGMILFLFVPLKYIGLPILAIFIPARFVFPTKDLKI